MRRTIVTDLKDDLVNLVTTNVVESAILNSCAGRVLESHGRVEQK